MAVRDSSPFIHVPISPARAHPRCLKLFISSFRPILIRSNCLRLHPSCISDAAASLPLLSCATVPSLPLPLCAVWRRFYTYSCRRSRQSHLGLVRRSAEARRVCGEWMRLSLRQYNLAHASAVGVRPDANPLPWLRCSCRCDHAMPSHRRAPVAHKPLARQKARRSDEMPASHPPGLDTAFPAQTRAHRINDKLSHSLPQTRF